MDETSDQVEIDRHPILAAGGGQNSRMLPDEAVVAYCDSLADRLSTLELVLDREQQEGRLSIAARAATHTFLQELRATLAVMALKHGRQLLEVEPMPLTIDPTESGMPTIKDFWELRSDRDHAQEQLRQLPTPEQLLEQARDAIFAGRRPIKQQILWLQRAYMERLAATPIVTDFRQFEPQRLSASGDKLYSVSWTGIIGSLNLFECTTLHFVERGGWKITGGIEDLRDLIDNVAGSRATLPEMVGLLNQAAWIVPRTIERVTIGPYHHRWTQNDELIARAFAAVSAGEEPFLLEARIERAATIRAAKRSSMDVLFGREPMESGPALRYRVLVAPLAIKQLLGNADEDGQPCTVYGVAQAGDLVG